MKENVKIDVLRLVVGLLSLLCLYDMPYGYYQLYRLIAMTTFIILAFNEKNSKELTIVWIFSALIVQPFFKISLGREIWNIIDILWSFLLILPVFYRKSS